MNKETPHLQSWTNPTENKNKMTNQQVSPFYAGNFPELKKITIRRKNTTKHFSQKSQANNFVFVNNYHY